MEKCGHKKTLKPLLKACWAKTSNCTSLCGWLFIVLLYYKSIKKFAEKNAFL